MVMKIGVDSHLLKEKISTKEAVVGVIGLGYVGLPLAVEAIKNGFSVIGFDKEEKKVGLLNAGESYITDLSNESIEAVANSGKFLATTDFENLREVDVIIVCVPTPINGDGSPNIQFVKEATTQISQFIKEDTLIILESTTYPGTTREVVCNEVQKASFVPGEQVFIAYSPERIDPGNEKYTIRNTVKIVGGLTERCTELAKCFYEESLKTKVHAVSNPEVAEIEKLLENTFRQVNIALVNELSKVCHELGIDVWEVIEAASTKPYGFMAFKPGPGIGGHCIPVDPNYLLWTSEQLGVQMSLISSANQVNDTMPAYVVERVKHYLIGQNKPLKEAELVLIGAAYKPDINDVRESPALKIIELLKKEQCHIKIVDPFIDELFGEQTVQLEQALIEKADGVVIITNHASIDYQLIDQYAAYIFDTRNSAYPFENKNYYKL